MSFLCSAICLGAALIFEKRRKWQTKDVSAFNLQAISPRDHFYTHSGVSYPFLRLRYQVVKRGTEKAKAKTKRTFWALNWWRNSLLMALNGLWGGTNHRSTLAIRKSEFNFCNYFSSFGLGVEGRRKQRRKETFLEPTTKPKSPSIHPADKPRSI